MVFAYMELRCVLSIVILVSTNCAIGRSVAENIFVHQTIPHDSDCFTQGLLYHKSVLYESCGLNGKSSIRQVDPFTGTVVRSQKIDDQYFAEGITIIENEMFMLTWKNKKMLIIDVDTFAVKKTIDFVSHNGEGWGLTHDKDNHLILSDGTEYLTFYEIPTQKTTKLTMFKELKVTDPLSKQPVVHINELEYVNGYIFANIWYKDIIIKIDAHTGIVVQKYDMSTLYPKAKRNRKTDCINGIAYNISDDSFLLTGKLWSKYYSVKLLSDAATTTKSVPNVDIPRKVNDAESDNMGSSNAQRQHEVHIELLL